MAEYETEVRAERVAAGQAVARRKGKKWGGSKKGWRWKVTDDQVAAIREMRAAGKKIAHIARVTGFEQADDLPRAGNCQPCEAPVIQRRNRFWKKSFQSHNSKIIFERTWGDTPTRPDWNCNDTPSFLGLLRRNSDGADCEPVPA